MRIKNPMNTVFNKTGNYRRKVKILQLKKAKFYFSSTSTDLEEIKSIKLEKKNLLSWVTIETNYGTYIEKIRFSYEDSNMLEIYQYVKTPLIYETREKFIKDFMGSTDDDFRILNNYKKTLNKKEKEMGSIITVQENLQKISPEYWL